MLKITSLFIDGGRVKRDARSHVTGTEKPVFRWSVNSSSADNIQRAFRASVSLGDTLLWDSGLTESPEQSVSYSGRELPCGEWLDFTLTVTDRYGESSEVFRERFLNGLLPVSQTHGKWIGTEEENNGRALYFGKSLELRKKVVSACLYVAGIGYHRVTVNGSPADDSLLEPAHSNYAKTVYYSVYPDIEKLLCDGGNELLITVADGWRNNFTDVIRGAIGDRKIEFYGRPLLWARLYLRYEDGTRETVNADENWSVASGSIVFASVFNGETYDARPEASAEAFHTAVYGSPCEELLPMTLEPIRINKEYPAIEITEPEKGVFTVDFGQNIAGVARLRLPCGLKAGQKVKIVFAEELENGRVFTAPLRGAVCTDTYIAAGDGNDLSVWQPVFTYHGFRYAEVTGLEALGKDDITGLQLFTDMKNGSFFRCGSAIADRIQQNIVMTEENNLHSILTDCPQRDERMGWMNDATVRFEETPYNFDTGRIFRKVIRDIRNEQRPEGQFSCCCPYVFGNLPADPVCSSYLVLGYELLMHSGDRETVKDSLDGFIAWEEYLLSHSDNYIVNYSYYGDWAAPGYACEGGEEGAVNRETEGILMSTGYSYFNCRLISRMAEEIGETGISEKYTAIAGRIKQAFLAKWWHPDTSSVGSGSEGAHAFALWLGILPEDGREAAAKLMRDDLVKRGYAFTTGNLCTRYLFDMLAAYGYINEAWALMTKEDYPSFGYMIQNEATTVWERFELKKSPGMNSHDHPMYGAAGYFFYAFICGIKPTAPGWTEMKIEPYFPDGLLSAQATVDTVKGDVSVRWTKRYGELTLTVQIPFGTEAEVVFDSKTVRVGSGYHAFVKKL